MTVHGKCYTISDGDRAGNPKISPVVWTCKRFHIGAAVGMLVVLLLLPLSLAMDDSKFDHGGGGGGGGGPATAAAAAVAAMDDNWRQKQQATRALMVA